MLIHFMGTLQQLGKMIEADSAGDGQPDGRPQGIAPANPIPETKHVVHIDTELGYLGRVGGKRHEMPGHVFGIFGMIQEPLAGRMGIGHGFLCGKCLGGDHKQGGFRIQRFQGLGNMGTVDVGNIVHL